MANDEGVKVKRRFHLPEEQRRKFDEIQAIRAQAQERVLALQQKIQDCTRLIEGMMTQIKWDQGWQDGDAVGYDHMHGDVVVLDFHIGE